MMERRFDRKRSRVDEVRDHLFARARKFAFERLAPSVVCIESALGLNHSAGFEPETSDGAMRRLSLRLYEDMAS